LAKLHELDKCPPLLTEIEPAIGRVKEKEKMKERSKLEWKEGRMMGGGADP
jgi:hypothetical protein